MRYRVEKPVDWYNGMKGPGVLGTDIRAVVVEAQTPALAAIAAAGLIARDFEKRYPWVDLQTCEHDNAVVAIASPDAEIGVVIEVSTEERAPAGPRRRR